MGFVVVAVMEPTLSQQ